MWSDLIRLLWSFTVVFTQTMSEVFNLLSSPVGIPKFEVLGVVIWEGFTFVPLAMGGGAIIAIMIVGFVSLLNPFN